MKVLFDTNVILDILLDREPFADNASRLMARVEHKQIQGYLCANTLTTIYYLLAKAIGKKSANQALKTLLNLFEITAVDQQVLQHALLLNFKDFEDAVLHESARLGGVDILLTRNPKDFKSASLLVQTPTELVAFFRSK